MSFLISTDGVSAEEQRRYVGPKGEVSPRPAWLQGISKRFRE